MARKRALYGTRPPSVQEIYEQAVHIWGLVSSIQGPQLTNPSAQGRVQRAMPGTEVDAQPFRSR